MAQPITDKHDTQVLSFKDFVDSVFTELNSPTNDWYVDLREYGFYYESTYLRDHVFFYEPTYWKNTLIPLAIRLYELAQNDDAIYWWLIREMSLVDLCKASKEDFRKREVFDVLLQLKPEHRRVILENCVPKHAEELQEALDNDALETFRSLLPLIDNDDTIYNISRVLMRVNEVRDIFERTIHYTKGDSLGILFVLLREYYRYFAGEYYYKNRYCDGLANNVFLALYQTQYREAKVEFCQVATEIGELWVKNLILDYFLNEDHMPKSVRDVLCKILQSKSHYVYHDLENALTFCDKDEQTEDLKKRVGGWLDLEKYTYTFGVFNREWRKTLPPFSCRCFNVRRSVRRTVQRNGNVARRKVQDNCVPYIDSKNAIPIENLLELRKDDPKLFEFKNEANSFGDRIGNGSQTIIEETLNKKARRLIGELLKIIDGAICLNSGYSNNTLELFFDAILIDDRKFPDERASQDDIANKLFQTGSDYEYNDMIVMVFCHIIGYLLSKELLNGSPAKIAAKIQSVLTKSRHQEDGEEDAKCTKNNLRSYIQKGKDGKKRPPGKTLIDTVLEELKG